MNVEGKGAERELTREKREDSNRQSKGKMS